MSKTKPTRRRTASGRPKAPADVTTLVSTVLDEEAQRRTEQAEREETKIVDDLLPGVGGDALPMRDVIRRGGAVTIGVLFALNFVDEFDRIAFAVLGPDIQRSLDISDAVLAIAGSLGGLLVFAAAIPIGYLADRMRRTFILGIFSAFWALFSVLTGLVRSSWQLMVARALTGIGKANEAPVQKPLLADAYPLEGRSRIYAIHNAANPVGNLLGPALAGGIAAVVGGTAGWRWAFVILSLPAAALAVAAFFLPEPKRGRGEQEAILGGELSDDVGEVPISLGPAFARLRKIKSYSYLLTAVAAIGFGFVTAPIFINLVLEEQFGLDAAGRGLVGTIVATGAVIGAVIGGRWGDELFRRSPERLMALVGLAVASFGVTMPISVYMPNVWGYLAVAWASALFTTGAFVPASAIIAAVTPFRLRSMGFAVIGVYLSLVGGVGGAVIAGGISDALGPQAAVAITTPIAALFGGALIVYGSRFVRRDIALTVADLREEEGERARVREGGKIPALQIRNLDFSYGHVQVLFDINVDVWPGEVLALLGTNGAGKSTLLRAVSGLGVPDRGAVRLDGRTITYIDPSERVRRGLVQVPGGKAIFPSLTVRENLYAGAYTYAWDTDTVTIRTDRVIEMFPSLRERIEQPAGTLSGGEQQMLAIAKALLLEPRILLIDELSLGLAPVVVQELLTVVEELKATGVTMVIVEQSVNVALALADRAIFMEKGHIRFEGAARDLLKRTDLMRAVFLGASSSKGSGKK